MVNDIVIDIAKVAHQANKAWCEANGDFSQPSWIDAPDWQRKSAIQSVVFHIENPDAGDSASHDNWMKEKIDNGWVYGEIKDPKANPPTHPCIVPFENLPKHQQLKDAMFRSTVHALIGNCDDKTEGLPVKGYQTQSEYNLSMVNQNKTKEEEVLRILDALVEIDDVDKRWLAMGRSHIQQGFMAVNRSIFKPKRAEI